jgi:glycosyltransferase involved in cell wall biosynthesis
LPTISIILPTYNGAKYIRHSIDSCLAQTFSDFELIIVNDCSTDETPEIIESYAQKDRRIKIIHNRSNLKLPLSLNKGFDHASGKYFTWTSDDNYYAPDALEKMVKVLEQDTSIDLVYCDYYIVDENDKITGKRIFNDVNKAFHKWIGAGACFLYKSHIHSDLKGYNPSAFLIEDYDFFTRAFIKYRFHYLQDHTVYYYREHPGSLTSTQANYLNNVAKIFLEKNLPGLEKKLRMKELGILYRKLAFYYGITMSNPKQFSYYLGRIRLYSLWQIPLVVGYVSAIKLKDTFVIAFTGIAAFFRLLFSPGSKNQ